MVRKWFNHGGKRVEICEEKMKIEENYNRNMEELW